MSAYLSSTREPTKQKWPKICRQIVFVSGTNGGRDPASLQSVVSDNAPYFVYAAVGLWGLWELKELVCGIKREVLRDPPRKIPSVSRQAIPLSVKHVVYYREKGKCRHCGVAFDLGYEHIIPLSHGGSNSVGNVELLCGICNAQSKDNPYGYLEERHLSG
jgi:hypothetical protein